MSDHRKRMRPRNLRAVGLKAHFAAVFRHEAPQKPAWLWIDARLAFMPFQAGAGWKFVEGPTMSKSSSGKTQTAATAVAIARISYAAWQPFLASS